MADKNSLLETDLPDYESDHFNASDIGGSTPKNSLLDTDIGNDETEKKSIQPVTKTQTTGMMPWSEAATEAVKNVPQSAYHNFVEPIVNYEQTLQGLKQVGKGLYSKAEGAFVDQDKAKKAEDEAAINALKQNYIDTYGSLEKFQQEFRKDPLRILSDASMLLTGGGSMAARLPGVVGKAGEAVATVGKAVDPIMAAAQVPKVAGKAITSALNVPATVQSGSAFGSLQKAYESGVSKDPIFWDHYSGKADANALIDKVSGAIDNVAKKRSADYIAAMDPNKAKTGLSYQPVLDEISNARGAQSRGIGSFYGQTTNRAAQDVLDNIENTVNTWMSKPNGTPFHTLEGFDALKRTIGDYRRDVRGNPEATKVVDNAYNAVKKAIVKVDPKYADIMDQYSAASQKLNDIKSLERGRSSETKINKILKTYRSGDKGNLLSDLYKHDPELISAIAGHDLSPLFPQGLRGILTSAPFYGGIAALGNVAHLPGLAMSSPKLMGGFNYGLGSIAGAPARSVENLPYLARQAPYGASRIDEANRQGRKSGGRVSHETIADQLIAAAESAKKMHGRRTEVLLDQPDETITKALAVAKQNI